MGKKWRRENIKGCNYFPANSLCAQGKKKGRENCRGVFNFLCAQGKMKGGENIEVYRIVG